MNSMGSVAFPADRRIHDPRERIFVRKVKKKLNS